MARCDSYDPGQCTAGACELNGWVEDYWGNGGDWAAAARSAGFEVTMTPTVGAVVCYCAGDGYSAYGHVATVEQVFSDGSFEVREENYIGPFEWDDRQSNQYDVCGFILPPGVSPGSGGAGGGAGSGGDTGSGPAGIQPVIAAYDTIRWYFEVTVPQQITSFQGIVARAYTVK